LRRVSHNLMPNNIIKYGLQKSLDDFFIELQYNLPEKKIRFEFFGTWLSFSQDKELNIYRIITEVINNVLKHSEADEILTQFIFNEKEVSITIEDNGKGFDVKNSSGMGLENVKSRIQYLNGLYDIKSEKNKGTSIFIHFPK